MSEESQSSVCSAAPASGQVELITLASDVSAKICVSGHQKAAALSDDEEIREAPQLSNSSISLMFSNNHLALQVITWRLIIDNFGSIFISLSQLKEGFIVIFRIRSFHFFSPFSPNCCCCVCFDRRPKISELDQASIGHTQA